MDYTQEINNIIATLEKLNIPATYDNLNRLMGCMQHLAALRDALEAEKKAEKPDA